MWAIHYCVNGGRAPWRDQDLWVTDFELLIRQLFGQLRVEIGPSLQLWTAPGLALHLINKFTCP